MRQFAIELEDLNQKLLLMGSLVETAIHRSTQALLDHDEGAARQVILDQRQIARLEMEVDGMATRLLALRQPVARDLRLLTVALKINADLKRMGELAEHVASRSISLIGHPLVKPLDEIPQMAARVQSMLLLCLQAFVHGYADMALSVIQLDDEVDALRDAVTTKVQEMMQNSPDPDAVPAAVNLIFIARNIERIGDHATNIAEDVVFLVKGQSMHRSAQVP